MNIKIWVKNIFSNEKIDIGSLWISRADLKENPFEQNPDVPIYSVLETSKGNGTGNKDTFLKIQSRGFGYIKTISLSESVFRDSYVLYNSELKNYWNLG